MNLQRTCLLGLCVMVTAACGSSTPTVPTPPTTASPALSCPASIEASSLDGLATPATFTPPVASGGQPPTPVSCSPASGASFPVGSTVVSCTATDALSRVATCNFNVTVSIAPRISKTRFLAFGDSITNGRCDASPMTCPFYTERMGELLRDRYTEQTFTIRTEGVNGERAENGLPRLAPLLASWSPEALLLMEGTNDVSGTAAQRLAAIDGLDDMIRTAQVRGIPVFLATIPPVRAGGSQDDRAAAIPGFNEEIRDLAMRREGVFLVDVFAAMNADVERYVGTDDLHPSPEGMLLIGETFYAALRSAYDTTVDGS